MVPDSTAAVLAFLLLLSPGLVFEWLRRVHRPSLGRQAFEEISTVVLASIAFTTTAIGVVLLINECWPGTLADLPLWAEQGDGYAREHPRAAAVTLGVAVGVSWFAALAANWLLTTGAYKQHVRQWLRRAAGADQGRGVVDHNMWWNLLAGTHRPDDAKAVWLEIPIADGRRCWGVLSALDVEGDQANPVVVLRRPYYADPPLPATPEVAWRRVVVPLSQVHLARVYYSNKEAPEPSD